MASLVQKLKAVRSQIAQRADNEAWQAWSQAENENGREARTAPVRTRITRNGIHMAFVALFAVLGGSIRGFNLLVILAGLMVGILIMQWRFCRAALPGLSVRRMLPSEAYAHSPFKVRFWVTNHRWWLPTWLVRLEDRIRGHNLQARGSDAICSVAMVRPTTTEAAHYDCTISRRGRYRFGPVRLATGFPFGLINAWKNTRTHATLVVYPALAKLKPNWSGIIENRREGLAASRHSSGPSEGEFYGIRHWQTGDSKRWIHWRTTARVGQLSVRQFEQRNRTQLSLLLDPYWNGEGEYQDDEDVEWAISITASIVSELSSQATHRMVLGIADNSHRVVLSHQVSSFRSAGLQLLASVRPLSEPPLAETLTGMLRDGNPRWPILIISPRPSRLDLLRGGDADGKAGVSAALLAKLDIMWLDVTSEACRRIATGRESILGKT